MQLTLRLNVSVDVRNLLELTGIFTIFTSLLRRPQFLVPWDVLIDDWTGLINS
jgi:hypothetical protein